MKIYEHNIETGEAIEREMTADEIDQFNLDKAAAEAEIETQRLKAEAKTIAETKLSALGLTTDDLKALGL